MKKILCCFLSFIFIVSLYTSTAFAVETNSDDASTFIEYLENGYYIETTITQSYSSSHLRFTNTTSGTKKVSYKNGDTVLWTVAVSGDFSYTGSSSTCTYASVSTTCPSSSWKISNKSASKSGNNAIANATGKNYQLGICIQTIDRTVKLSCSPTGKLS